MKPLTEALGAPLPPICGNAAAPATATAEMGDRTPQAPDRVGDLSALFSAFLTFMAAIHWTIPDQASHLGLHWANLRTLDHQAVNDVERARVATACLLTRQGSLLGADRMQMRCPPPLRSPLFPPTLAGSTTTKAFVGTSTRGKTDAEDAAAAAAASAVAPPPTQSAVATTGVLSRRQ